MSSCICFIFKRIVGFERQLTVLAHERAGAAFEVEAGFDFASDVRERVIDLGEIGFRDNVETGHLRVNPGWGFERIG